MAYRRVSDFDDCWDFKSHPNVEFVLVSKKDGVGMYHKTLYTIEELTKKGRYSIWGSAILDRRMAHLAVGQRAKLTYKGTKQNAQGKTMQDFELEAWTDDNGEEAFGAETDITNEGVPF